MVDASLLALALLCSVCGMGWFALAKDPHFHQVLGQSAKRARSVRAVRGFGYVAVFASLALCLSVDHGSMASLVWIMMLTAAALLVTFALAFRPRWLTFLTLGLR